MDRQTVGSISRAGRLNVNEKLISWNVASVATRGRDGRSNTNERTGETTAEAGGGS